jgi:hypothetical protein
LTEKALANVDDPPPSVRVKLYEPVTVAAVETNFAVTVVAVGCPASVTLENVTPGALVVRVTVLLLFARSVSEPTVNVSKPDAPVPKEAPDTWVPR